MCSHVLCYLSLQSRVDSSWQVIGAAPASARISLLFALKHSASQLADLEQLATSVSTPGSGAFREYLTMDEMNARFAPPVTAQDTVIRYLQQALRIGNDSRASNVTDAVLSVPSPGWVRVSDVTVTEATHLLHTEFYVYEQNVEAAVGPPWPPGGSSDDASFSSSSSSSADVPFVRPVDHASRGSQVIRAKSGYSLPTHVADVVDFIGGVTNLPRVRFQAQTFVVSDDAHLDAGAPTLDTSYVVTPSLLRQQYNIPSNASGTDSASNQQVVPQFLEQYFSYSDLSLFLTRNDIRPRLNVSRVIGLNVPSNPGGEASLDIQLIMGMAPGVRTELWSFSGRRDPTLPPSNFNQEPFLDWLVLLAATPHPPLVHSVSYADDEKDCTPAYMRRVNVEFQKAAARGISILFASGDDGIGSIDARSGKPCTQANPTFPSSSPFITSIGGTQLAPRTPEESWSTRRQEITCSSRTGCVVTTGGGFSGEFARPAYQSAAVDAFLAASAAHSPSLTPPKTWFNSSGRGFPDIAALATNFEIIMRGRPSRIGGTSASTPVIGAMFSLWNEKLIAAGKPQIGFANPWLYTIAKEDAGHAFNDVTSGQAAGR